MRTLFVTLACVLAATLARADDEPPRKIDYLPANERLLLTAQQFEGLSPDTKLAYISLLREFLTKLDSDGVSVAHREGGPLREFLAALASSPRSALIYVDSARANDIDPPLVIKPRADNTCPPGYTGDGGLGQCVLQYMTMRGSAPCPAGTRTHVSKTPGSSPRTICYKEAFYTEWNQRRREQEALLAESPAAVIKDPVITTQDPEIYHPVVTPESRMLAPPQDDKEKAKPAEPDNSIYDNNFKRQLACIYAGFPILGPKCEAKSTYTIFTAGKAYTCTDGKDIKSATIKTIVAPKNPSKGKNVLCNPAIFGLNKDGEPFCVGKGGSATKECKRLAELPANKEKSLKSAAEIMLEDRKFVQNTNVTIQHLCSGKYDADLRKSLQQRGRPNVEASLQDIKSTCNVYSERFAEFQRAGINVPSGLSTGGGQKGQQ